MKRKVAMFKAVVVVSALLIYMNMSILKIQHHLTEFRGLEDETKITK